MVRGEGREGEFEINLSPELPLNKIGLLNSIIEEDNNNDHKKTNV